MSWMCATLPWMSISTSCMYIDVLLFFQEWLPRKGQSSLGRMCPSINRWRVRKHHVIIFVCIPMIGIGSFHGYQAVLKGTNNIYEILWIVCNVCLYDCLVICVVYLCNRSQYSSGQNIPIHIIVHKYSIFFHLFCRLV